MQINQLIQRFVIESLIVHMLLFILKFTKTNLPEALVDKTVESLRFALTNICSSITLEDINNSALKH